MVEESTDEGHDIRHKMNPPTSKPDDPKKKVEDPDISLSDIPNQPSHHHHTNRMSILASASRINKAMIPSARSSVSARSSLTRASKTNFKVSQMKLPGNAGAKMVQSKALNITPRPVQNLTTHEEPAALLHMEAMTPAMLQMEIEKQAQQLNRMASLRHSTLVKTKMGSHMHQHHAGMDGFHEHSPASTRASHYRFSLASGERGSHKKERSGSRGEEGGSSSEEDNHEHEHLIKFNVPDEEEEEEDHHEEYHKRNTPFYTDHRQVVATESLEAINAKARASEARKRKSSRTRRVMHKEWERQTSVLANGVHNVARYRSKHTGLHLVHCKVDSPEMYGYFVFRHRCDDDLGLPHIVQHMVFLGSKMFPYPGILDQFAVQCLASGVDAWTQADHSCYTLKTVGKEGFLAILPLYLDHLFHPNLNEAGYLTEVHHLSSHGVDRGVCYLEMKSSAHDPVQMAHWGLMQEIFPTNSGYYRPYSGDYKELRSKGSLEAVQEFHKKFYTASNASLIICGDMDVNELFEALQPMVLSLSVDMKREGSTGTTISPNPWAQEAVTSIPEMAETTLRYPSETEGQGEVKVAILGAGPDPVLSTALDILFEYLTYSQASPLQEAFLYPANQQPLASHLSLLKLPLLQPLFILSFQNVPEEKTKEVVPLLREVLQKEATNTFSPHRMAEVLHHSHEQALALLENQPQSTLATALIQDFIYNFNGDAVRFDRLVNRAYSIQHLASLQPSFWTKLIESVLDTAFASITTLPSRSEELRDAQEKEEEERKQENIATFGKDKLREKALRLKAAHRWNARKVPEDAMAMLKPPPLDGFSFLYIQHYENPLFCPNSLHYLLLDDLNSNYVYLTCIMDTSELSLEEKKYLPLFGSAILETGYVDDGENHFSPHDLIEGLSRDILKYETFFGLQPPLSGVESQAELLSRAFTPAQFSHLFCIRFQLEMRRVREGFAWMETLLWKTKWESDRLKNVCQRMANEVRTLLDQGPVMTRMMISELLYHMNSNVRVMSLVRQQAWLERIASELPRAFTRVGKMLEGIRNVVLRPENVMVHLATSLTKLDFYLTDKPEVKDAMPTLLKETFDYTGWNWGYPTRRLANEPDSKWMKSRTCMSKCRTEQILRMHAAEEGASLLQASPCIQTYTSEDYVALLVAIAYFTQNEGPFHKEIRDPGYASTYSIVVRPDEGLIYFEIKNAMDLVNAYTAAYAIILEHVGQAPRKRTTLEEEQMREVVETLDLKARTISVSTPNIPERSREQDEDELWSETLLRSAKSAAIFHLVEEENTPKTLAFTSLKNHFCGVSEDYGRALMARIPTLTMAEVKRVTKAWLGPLFGDTSTCAVAAPEKNVPGIIKGMMDNCGKRLTLLPPLYQSELATF